MILISCIFKRFSKEFVWIMEWTCSGDCPRSATQVEHPTAATAVYGDDVDRRKLKFPALAKGLP